MSDLWNLKKEEEGKKVRYVTDQKRTKSVELWPESFGARRILSACRAPIFLALGLIKQSDTLVSSIGWCFLIDWSISHGSMLTSTVYRPMKKYGWNWHRPFVHLWQNTVDIDGRCWFTYWRLRSILTLTVNPPTGNTVDINGGYNP